MTLEFGQPVENNFKFSVETELQQKGAAAAAHATLGKAIFGLATSYYEIHKAQTGQTEIFAPGCFDETLKSGLPVALLFEHKSECKVSDGDRLELYSDRDGLWFRFFPTDHKNHQVILDAVADGTLSQMSVGYTVLKDTFFKMQGFSHRLIQRAHLGEISFVAGGTAAVKSTSAIVVDGGDLRANLRDDVAGTLAAGLRARIKNCTF